MTIGSNEWNTNCDTFCNVKFYRPDSGCSSETDDTEVNIGRFRSAELEENIFMKLWRFIIESNSIIEKFKEKQ